jgi:hypothetical protein
MVREVVIEAIGRRAFGEKLGEERRAGVDNEAGAVMRETLVRYPSDLGGVIELNLATREL